MFSNRPAKSKVPFFGLKNFVPGQTEFGSQTGLNKNIAHSIIKLENLLWEGVYLLGSHFLNIQGIVQFFSGFLKLQNLSKIDLKLEKI